MPEINNSEKLLHNLSRDLIRRAICLKQFQEAITLAGLVQLVKSVWEKEKPPEGLSEEEKKKFKVTPTEMQQKVIKWLLDMEEVLELFIHAEKLLLRYFPETFETIQSICYLLEGRTQSALVSEFSINDPMVLLPSSFVKATNNRFKRDSRVIETIIGRPTSRRTWNSFHLESFIPLRESTDKYIDAPSLMHISTLNEKVEVKPNGDIYSKVLFRHAKTGNRTFVPPVVNSKTILHAHGDEFWRNFLRELNKYVAMTPVSLFYFLLHILTSFIGTSIDSKAFVLILCPHDSG
ncbi:MAG: hypothetical protein JNL74_11270, partial [Fibrobacteres bacterium]|nr:hypothetical protein [Fibrobacterota bacterium]